MVQESEQLLFARRLISTPYHHIKAHTISRIGVLQRQKPYRTSDNLTKVDPAFKTQKKKKKGSYKYRQHHDAELVVHKVNEQKLVF